jgi:type IV pilus assembly protein PilM
VQNCFSSNYEVPSSETVVLINAGAAVVNINIVASGITTFTRDVTIGGNQFTEEIQKQMNVSFEEAEALKIGGRQGDADAVVPQEVERVMTQVAEQVAGEIQRSPRSTSRAARPRFPPSSRPSRRAWACRWRS